MLCHQDCLTRDGKKICTIPLTSFLFTGRHDKWLVSVPPENNITLAWAVCPCLLSLPLPCFLFFFLFSPCHISQTFLASMYAHTSPTLSQPSLPYLYVCLKCSALPYTSPLSLTLFPSHRHHHLSSPSSPQNWERSQHYSSKGAGRG